MPKRFSEPSPHSNKQLNWLQRKQQKKYSAYECEVNSPCKRWPRLVSRGLEACCGGKKKGKRNKSNTTKPPARNEISAQAMRGRVIISPLPIRCQCAAANLPDYPYPFERTLIANERCLQTQSNKQKKRVVQGEAEKNTHTHKMAQTLVHERVEFRVE